jgi:hypothetical protein
MAEDSFILPERGRLDKKLGFAHHRVIDLISLIEKGIY